jgi:hypothetical protein
VRPALDYLELAGCALLVAAWFLPWYRMGEQVLRPAELPWGWALPLGCAALALLLLQPLAGWRRPLVLLVGGLLLGLTIAALLVPLAFNALWWQVIGAPLDALAAELDSWTRLPLVGGRIAEWQAALRALPGRFLVHALAGPWLLAVGALVLILSMYRAVVPPPPAPPRLLPPGGRLALSQPGARALPRFPAGHPGPGAPWGASRPAVVERESVSLAPGAGPPGNRCLGAPP